MNPLLRSWLQTAKDSTAPDIQPEEPTGRIEPVMEEVPDFHPYRGVEDHGVDVKGMRVLPNDYTRATPVHYEDPRVLVDPISVVVVKSPDDKREHNIWEGRSLPIFAASDCNLVQKDDRITEISIIGTVDLLVSSGPNAAYGYLIPANTRDTIKASGPVFCRARTTDGTVYVKVESVTKDM